MCRWAAARPRAVRAASFARRVVSKPGQAPPPPTGTAARPSGCSGALHTCGAGCADVLLGPSNFARNSPATCLDIEFVSLELQRFRRVLKSDRGKLCAKFVWTMPRASKPARALWIIRRTSHLWGLVCCCVGSLDLCLAFGTKFSLLGFLVVRTVQNSPCMQKVRQIEPFLVCGESFVPDMRRGRVCGESFVPEVAPRGSCWANFVLLVGQMGSCRVICVRV